MHPFIKKSFQVFGLSFIASTGFIIGSCFHKNTSAQEELFKKLDIFAKVLEHIESNFVEEVKTPDLVDGALKGMLKTLDPHSSYLDEKIYKEFKEDTEGKFGGLGIEVSIQDKEIVVIAAIEDSPAAKVDIRSGDIIAKVGDKFTNNMSLAEAVTIMRGKAGSKLKIFIKRKDEKKLLSKTITREIIKVRSVKNAIYKKDTGYIRISSFMENTARELKKVLESWESQKLNGIILDLRGNPGGLLDQAVQVTNLFIEEGPIVYTIGRNKEEKKIESALPGQKISDHKLVIIQDASSASASEIVAGALQDHKRAVVVGQKSFGKGSVQTIIPVSKNSGLKLTIARYYTPAGRSIQAQGIEPDFHIDYIDEKTLEQIEKQNKSLREVDLSRHFENEKDTAIKEEVQGYLEKKIGKDYMVSQARGILRTMDIVQLKPQKIEFREPSSVSGGIETEADKKD